MTRYCLNFSNVSYTSKNEKNNIKIDIIIANPEIINPFFSKHSSVEFNIKITIEIRIKNIIVKSGMILKLNNELMHNKLVHIKNEIPKRYIVLLE